MTNVQIRTSQKNPNLEIRMTKSAMKMKKSGKSQSARKSVKTKRVRGKFAAKKSAPKAAPQRIGDRRAAKSVVKRQPAAPSLYERLGGVYSIAAVVDDFIDRVMDDARLNANPKVDEAHHRVSRSGFKYLVTEQVCWATGGPQKYTGRSMRDSHEHLAITPVEWEAFLDDFHQTLDKFGVPAVERDELFAIVDSTRADIVVGK
jgi:hemoglobin